jgi:beta-N-acetylhexosaminidase
MPQSSATHRFRRRALPSLAVIGALALAASPLAAATDTTGSGTSDSTGAAAYVAGQLADMTLEEKVGQLFVTHVYGSGAHTVTPAQTASNQRAYGVNTPAEVVEKYNLGGVIYFAWSGNVGNIQDTARLSNGLQEVAIGDDNGPPLMISTDQEGGLVVRLSAPATAFPGSQALGAGGKPEDARRVAEATGRELRAVGITQNFAPVADVNVNAANPVIGVRSFGSDPQAVAELVGAQVDGYQNKGNVSAAAKHFPGHGDTTDDSHLKLPIIDHSREEWEEIDAPPFKEAIERGIDVIMTAHIVVPSLDPTQTPATLSEPIMNGILRGELGYDGVVITDALQMAGITSGYGTAEAVVMALNAGVDQLLMPLEGEMDIAYQAVLDAVRAGEISEDRIDQSVTRILNLKWDRGVVADPFVDVSQVDAIVGNEQHLNLADRVTERTITALRNTDADGQTILPADVSGKRVLVTGSESRGNAILADELGARGAITQVRTTGTRPSDTAIAGAVAAAEQSDLTVVTSYRAWDRKITDPNGRQKLLVEALAGTGTPTLAVAARDPYDVAYFPEEVGYLATYSNTTVSMRATARVIAGEIPPQGKLPVDIPAMDGSLLFPLGFGLQWGE